MTVADLAQERQVTVEALVDTGATYVSLPASRARQLGIEPAERRTFVLTDGRRADYEVGFGTVSLDGRSAPTLIVLADEGSEPLVGAVILETLGLAADPVGKKLVRVPSFLL
jgi:clan AA aspartic protease